MSTHAVTSVATDGANHYELDNSPRPYAQQLARFLGLLGDDGRYAFSLWPTPSDVDFDDIDLVKYPIEYLQSAGSAEGLTIEIRRIEADGQPHQYAVAKGTARSGQPDFRLDYGVAYLDVFTNEVFTAEEATPVYVHYYETGELPPGLGLRKLDL